jgi:hypothetical protein
MKLNWDNVDILYAWAFLTASAVATFYYGAWFAPIAAIALGALVHARYCRWKAWQQQEKEFEAKLSAATAELAQAKTDIQHLAVRLKETNDAVLRGRTPAAMLPR